MSEESDKGREVSEMKEFNIIVTGIGGQGVLTLVNVIAFSALSEGRDVKTSELHGLAQRSGKIVCHVRFGEEVYSPLVLESKADLIMGLEPLEALRACYYGSKYNKTVFLINSNKILPLSVFVAEEKYPSLNYIVDALEPFSGKVIVLDASDKVKNATGDIILTNIYMLGYATAKNLIQLKKESILKGIDEAIPERYLKLNKQVFDLGFTAEQ